MDFQMRVVQIGDLNIKFLIRYEVTDAKESVSKYRFKRLELNLIAKELFQFVPTFHISKKLADQFNTHLETRMSQIYIDSYKSLFRLNKPDISQLQIV